MFNIYILKKHCLKYNFSLKMLNILIMYCNFFFHQPMGNIKAMTMQQLELVFRFAPLVLYLILISHIGPIILKGMLVLALTIRLKFRPSNLIYNIKKKKKNLIRNGNWIGDGFSITILIFVG